MSKAEDEAKRILANAEYTLPIDVHAIARSHGITILTVSLEDPVSGLLVVKNGNATIGVNENHHLNRQRFSLAHELGHYLLHRDKSSVFLDEAPIFFRDEKSSDGSEREEIEANAFAAALLMPEALLREIVRNKPLDAQDDVAVRRLATQFGVSTQALTIRLTRLGFLTG